MAAASPASSRWLFGPAPDLLLGCGALYLLLFVASAVLGPDLRESQAPYLFPLLVLLLSTPHYGATLLRVYEERSSRRAYAVFSVWATLLVFAAFVVSVHSRAGAAWLLTIYLTWSPWHYTGQNYGLAVMFLRRRGVEPEPREKRLLHASFILSYALVFVLMHREGPGVVDRPLAASGSAVAFLPLGIPAALADGMVWLLLVSYAASLVGAAWLLLRRGTPGDLAPSATLVLTQALWFTLPFAARGLEAGLGFEAADPNHRAYYLSWIVAGHAVQYLWVTTYYARGSPGWRGYTAYLAKALAAGLAIWSVPAVVFAPKALGSLGYAAGLGLLVAAAVNIHHFILDGAIWKLRHTRIARVLIRDEGPELAAPAQHGSWGRGLVWGLAAAGSALGIFFFWAEELAYPAALERRDFARARAIRDGLAFFGRDNKMARVHLRRAEERHAQAMEELEARLESRPSPDGYLWLGRLREEQGQFGAARRAYARAVELRPGDANGRASLERAARLERSPSSEARAPPPPRRRAAY